MAHPFFAALERRVLLADGAMGTLLRDRGVPAAACLDEQNLSNPDLVRTLHEEYLTAGAEIIEANTFGANRLRLRPFGLADRVREINIRGAEIARESIREHHQAFVAGAIGPVGVGLAGGGDVTLKQAHKAFVEQAEALVAGGVDLIVLETFATLAEAREAVLAVREAARELPIIALITFQRDGRTWTGEEPAEVARELHSSGADVVGVNCVTGPQAALDIIEEMAKAAKVKLAALPNAGNPRVSEREVTYPVSPRVFAEYVPRFAGAGCVIVGGCCGTTPEHIAAMRDALRQSEDGAAAIDARAQTITEPAPSIWLPPDEEIEPEQATLREKLAAGRFVITAEIDPPRGLNPRRALKGAARLKLASIDCINVGDSPMARVRMSPFAMAIILRQQLGVETIIHVTTRDRNLLAIQSDLLGAHVLGLRNVLCLKGDAPTGQGYARAVGVWDVTPVGLIRVLKGLNEGIDWAGNPMAQPTSFFVGSAANPTASSLEAEIKLLKRKAEAGADFVLTQAVYDIEALERFLAKASKMKVPILLGVMPLHSERHAEFIHNELAGVVVPEAIRNRMREAGDRGAAEGLAIAKEIIAAARGAVQGIYLIPSFDRYDLAAELVESLTSVQVPAGRPS